jgi:hypothetical protein
MRWVKTVNLAAERAAQARIADILLLAFQRMEQKEDVHETAIKFLRHRCNEHSIAKNNSCTCELCMVYKDIHAAQISANMFKDGFRSSDSVDKMFYRNALKNVQFNLLKLHNHRRKLLGFSERKFHSIKNPPCTDRSGTMTEFIDQFSKAIPKFI